MIEGHSIASREYGSKHEYLEEFVKPFGARFLASERFRPTNIRSVHADGNTVIVLWDGRGIAIDGKPYENCSRCRQLCLHVGATPPSTPVKLIEFAR